MPRHSIIIYSLLLLFAMACSTSGRVDTMLLEAESLMMEHPDSALAILDSISPSQLTSDRQHISDCFLEATGIAAGAVIIGHLSKGVFSKKYSNS